jgi:hypothetical protein
MLAQDKNHLTVHLSELSPMLSDRWLFMSRAPLEDWAKSWQQKLLLGRSGRLEREAGGRAHFYDFSSGIF